MTRFLAILVFLLLVWWALEKLLRAALATPQGRQARAIWRAMREVQRGGAPSASPGPRRSSPGRLVRCSVCGTHVVEERARVLESGPPAVIVCSEGCQRRREAARG